MRKVVASLAAALLAVVPAACGGSSAEPGASGEATLVLDFSPNAVHSGIYTALQKGLYKRAGVELQVREPSASTDAPKLLEAGSAEFAIMDLTDLAIARQRGLAIVGVAPLVLRPLAAVLAGSDISRPRELDNKTVGVTGLPSDEAVVDTIVASDGGDPDSLHSLTIGFNAVASLAAGKVAAATGFWNAEGVTLHQNGVPINEFRVGSSGGPLYPELVLATTTEIAADNPQLVDEVAGPTERGGNIVRANPREGLDALVAGAPGLDRGQQRAQLSALLAAHALGPARAVGGATYTWAGGVVSWASWASSTGLISAEPDPRRFGRQMLDLRR